MKPIVGDAAKCNAAVVRRAVERIWNGGDLTLADHLFDLAYVNHGGLISDVVHGPEAIKISVALYRTAFPDLHIAVDRLVTEGDMVELGWVAHTSWGAHSLHAEHFSQGETLTGTTCSRLCDGQIVESWTTWDREGAMRRLAPDTETRWDAGDDVISGRPDG